MSTPRETAAEQWYPSDAAQNPETRNLHAYMRTAFRNGWKASRSDLAQHRDDIARVIDAHRYEGNGYCTCGVLMEHETDGVVMEVYESRHVADAVLAYLTGEPS